MGDYWASEVGELFSGDGYNEYARGILSYFEVLFMGFKLKVKGGRRASDLDSLLGARSERIRRRSRMASE